MARSLIVLACSFLLLVPGAAAAQTGNAPPGSAGIQQYVETIPEAGGDRPVRGGNTPSDEPVVDAATRKRLLAAGPEGRELLATLERVGSPAPKLVERRPEQQGAPQKTDVRPGGAAAAVATGLVESGAGGMGWALPALLVVSLAVTVVVGLRRRRSA